MRFDDADATADATGGSDAAPDAERARRAAGSVSADRDSTSATPDAVMLGDPAMAADSAARVSRRDVEAQRERATAPKKTAAPEPNPDPAEQYLRRQLDEFRAENSGRIRPFDGAEHVGSVVAAAIGTAIVHIGRLEYVDVPLPAGAAPPDVGTNVSIDRDGAIEAVAQHEHRREPISLDRSL